jgi:dTDP-4-dehydrorhamnose 3,5-epimerase
MIFHEQKLQGVYIIEPEPYADERGLLRRYFCAKEFSEHELMTDIKQCNVSENKIKYTLRGFHYQIPPHAENKLLSCVKGAIYDIVADVRKGSETYLKWQSFQLSEENRLGLYVPVGCANAYLTLNDNTWIFYCHSEFYAPGAEGGIRYNDPFFKFNWPAKPEVISDKDLSIPLVNAKILPVSLDI